MPGTTLRITKWLLVLSLWLLMTFPSGLTAEVVQHEADPDAVEDADETIAIDTIEWPEGVEPAQTDPLYFARWNLNYGKYLIDVGKYLEALESFQTAIEATDSSHIQANAHVQRASTFALFLDAFNDAKQEYTSVVEKFPQAKLAETARFQLGMLAFDQQHYPEATSHFETYLQHYPNGRFAASATTLAEQSRTPTPQMTQPTANDLTKPISGPSRLRPQVRVRVLKSVKKVTVSSPGLLTISSLSGKVLHQTKNKVTIRPDGNRLRVAGRRHSLRDVRISASGPIVLYSRAIRCQRSKPKQAGLYRGTFRVSLNKNRLRAINEVDIEKYLYGVVPSEVPASWPREALKSQAIAARTYALYQTRHRRRWQHDVVDNAGDQVYRGKRCETKRSTKAVDATRGQVLTYGKRPILAMYTSNTGWHSASVGQIFGKDLPYLVGVPDPYSPTQPMGKWRRTYPATEVRRKLARIGLRFGAIMDIIPQRVTPSGRVTKVKLVHAKGARTLRARTTLRRALNLPDVLIRIRRDQQSFVFEGGGFGHGVGLSQWGAKRMADKGKSVRDILRFYYDRTRLQTLW